MDLRDDRKLATRRNDLQEVKKLNAEVVERKAQSNKLVTYQSFMECLGAPTTL